MSWSRELGILVACTAACSTPTSVVAPSSEPGPISVPTTEADHDALPLALPGFLAEGLAWDAERNRLLVGGIVGQQIVAVSVPSGNADPFARPPRPWSVFGLKLDDRHGVVWAACSAVPQGQSLPSPVGPAALVAFSLHDGTVVAEHALEDDHEHLFGDLAVGRDGTIFVTDTLGGGIYAASWGVPGLREVVPPETFRSVQGIVVVDASTLIVADYPTGLVRIELDEHHASQELEVLKTPTNVDLRGIDGLVRRGQSLAGIQNGAQPPRVIRLELSADARSIESGNVLIVPDPQAGEPTLATFVNDSLWVMQTDLWDRVFDGDGRPREDVEVVAPTVVRIPWEPSQPQAAPQTRRPSPPS